MKNKISDKSERCSFLDRMTKSSRARVRKAKALESEVALLRRASLQPLPPPLVLGDFNIIAELKRRSPAMGNLIDTTFADENQLNAYVEGGASAISILTEPEEFKGCLTDLRDASTLLFKSGIPTLRKDFLTDSYQVLEARAAGASGILVIVASLSNSELNTILNCANENGLFILLECFDEQDLERLSTMCINSNYNVPILCGINCRDLKTLQVDFERFCQLAPQLPPELPAVAESGINSEEDIKAVAKLGYRTVLIGSALMQSKNTEEKLTSLKKAGLKELGSTECL